MASLKISKLIKEPRVFIYLLATILLAIPLKYIFGSISCILFLLVAFSSLHPIKFKFNKTLLLPVLFYVLMLLSLIWTRDVHATKSGLQKEVLLFLIPTAFLLVPNLGKIQRDKIFRIYGFGMVGYALYYFGNALFRYIATGNKAVFFYHELVTLDLNAIYVAVFASFAMFYFIALDRKNSWERAAIFILAIFIFLLSSKSIIFIDFLLIICFYIFFSDTKNSVKFVTIASLGAFLLFSLVFVKQIRERFLIEYETAFVDNTVNENDSSIANISLKQAWNNEKFNASNYFPGGALRVYQFRIFTEMLQEDNILFTGYGLEASQFKIKQKEKEHNLHEGYGDFNFHNEYVQTFAELGLFGFLILGGMLFLNIKNAIADKNFLHIVFSLTMIILFLTESFFCRQRGIVFFTILYCIFNVVNKSQKEVNQ
ncbi:MAG: O-antigen ligase family protein [Flavobacterium sp.]|nr:O-antigen ligase family protein [Flavobacterium sp.]